MVEFQDEPIRQGDTDPMTRLLIRRAFLRAARKASGTLDETDMITALLIDIDRFKAINDSHGHAVGDDVIRGAANVLRETGPCPVASAARNSWS